MIKDAYVQYQSRKAAKDLFDAMELLPGRVKMERDVHYIDDKTAVPLHQDSSHEPASGPDDGGSGGRVMAVRLFMERQTAGK